MSDTRMTEAERMAFLADLHVGVLSVPRAERAPLTAPIWYAYEPGGDIIVVIGRSSLKGRLAEVGLQVTLVAQREEMPYAYVSVEGRIAAIEPGDVDRDIRPLAYRYLGEDVGEQYTASTEGRDELRVAIRPERWLTVDYAKSIPG